MESAARKIEIDMSCFHVVGDAYAYVFSFVMHADNRSSWIYPGRCGEFGGIDAFGVPGRDKCDLQNQRNTGLTGGHFGKYLRMMPH